MIFDIVVIGAGVIGAFIARELSRYEVSVCVLEKEHDAAMGASGSNSGIVHAGYDNLPGTMKARMNIEGSGMMEKCCMDLCVPYKKNGSLVLAFNDDDNEKLFRLYKQGLENGVSGLEIINKDLLFNKEPNISPKAIAALYAPSAAIVSPFELTLGALENAVQNGVEYRPEREVISIVKEEGIFVIETKKEVFRARFIVNAAGINADIIAGLVRDDSFSIKPRKGEYFVLDKRLSGLVNSVIFQTPGAMGKGILVAPTVEGNILIGPNAHDIDDRNDISTTSEGLNEIIEGALKSAPSIDINKIIRSFAGLRAVPSTHDFIICVSKTAPGFINTAGIESPGLTSAPAIALYTKDLLRLEGLRLENKKSFNPQRKMSKRFSEMSDIERETSIKGNTSYGRIVCRCENVTEAEVINAIRSNVGAASIEGIRKRTRAGMGRCQGGFCTSRIIEILSKELGLPKERITKAGDDSFMLSGKTKNAGGMEC